MQYDLDLILKLADECEKGEGPDRDLDARIECAAPFSDHLHSYKPAKAPGNVTAIYANGRCGTYSAPYFTSSIDDTEDLRNRLLPESGIDVVIPAKGVRNYIRHRATVFGYETDLLRCSEASSEPRARTAAALRAFVAKERAK